MNRKRIAIGLVLATLVWSYKPGAEAQTTYQKPPKPILEILDAPANPMVSVSPAKDVMLLSQPVRYPSIADLAEPMLRLAGSRINPKNNGPHRPFVQSTSLTLRTIPGGKETKLIAPQGAKFGTPIWSPDGKQFAITNTTANTIELWIGETQTAKLKKLPGVGVNLAFGPGVEWMPDGKSLLVQTVAANRGPAPVASTIPEGPNVQENYGKVSPAWTYQDLLRNAFDEKLFDFYATSQLAVINSATGKAALVGKPAIFDDVEPSPDGAHFLVVSNHRPYSYLLPQNDFPKEIEVWDRSGKVIHKLASLPLQDQVPIEGVPTGARQVGWRPTEPATLVWVEALDGGDTKKKAALRDVVKMWKAPFAGQPAELLKLEQRFQRMAWGEKDGVVLISDFDRSRRWTRTFLVNAEAPAQAPKVIWDRSSQDRYKDPGVPVTKRSGSGRPVIHQNGDEIFLSGLGASDQGDRPFLDRYNLKTGKTDRLFRCEEGSFESFIALAADDGSKFITSSETSTSPPNYYLRTAGGGAKQALTEFRDPTPQLQGIKKQLVRYKRKDGVDLSFTLYLPPDYKQGDRLPTVVWAYPIEFSDASTAGQVSGSANRYTTISGMSHLFFLLQGYAVLDNTTMPIVGKPEEMNNTYVEQIVASAEAAINKAVEMGVTDRNRVGVGGHSYGAFMTANLLAHCDLFKAGIARSGAYNRTLTPFGFQSERRTFWEAPEMYFKVSPFMWANKIKEPILLTHGEADNNAGTHPIQSDRFYQALKGNGANVRYVTLPLESHGYAARQSIEHTLWEMITWFDKYVKQSQPTASR